jgi:hypothetical protein
MMCMHGQELVIRSSRHYETRFCKVTRTIRFTILLLLLLVVMTTGISMRLLPELACTRDNTIDACVHCDYTTQVRHTH